MSDNRVLVVDDEAINLMLIEDFLEQEQLVLELFSDPLAAWQRLASPDSDFALVVLDRMMPGWTASSSCAGSRRTGVLPTCR